MNSEQQALFDGVMKLIEEYVRQCRHPVNGPDPSRDASEAILKRVIFGLVKDAVK